MAISASTIWRIRPGGNNVNGGGYDASIAGAGTDYTEQDAAQLALTDIVTTGSTTVTSVTGGFTAAMIGNCLRIAGDNYYFITARASTNSITVDRATGTGTGQTGKVGGAWADLTNWFTGGTITQPLIASPVVPGNVIYMRGSGSDNPSVDDYVYDHNSYAIGVSGSANRIRIVGYNGRPRISYSGLMGYGTTFTSIENLYIVIHASGAYANGYPGFFMSATSRGCYAVNCLVDVTGHDCTALACSGAINCCIVNSGSTSPGTAVFGAIDLGDFGGGLIGCSIIGARTSGVYCRNINSVIDTIIANCGQAGIYLYTTNEGFIAVNNTIHGNGASGIYLNTTYDALGTAILNNSITGNGGYGIECNGTPTSVNDNNLGGKVRNNNFGTGGTANASGAYKNFSGGTNDVTVDPQYTDAAGLDFSVGTNLKAKGFPTVQ